MHDDITASTRFEDQWADTFEAHPEMLTDTFYLFDDNTVLHPDAPSAGKLIHATDALIPGASAILVMGVLALLGTGGAAVAGGLIAGVVLTLVQWRFRVTNLNPHLVRHTHAVGLLLAAYRRSIHELAEAGHDTLASALRQQHGYVLDVARDIYETRDAAHDRPFDLTPGITAARRETFAASMARLIKLVSQAQAAAGFALENDAARHDIGAVEPARLVRDLPGVNQFVGEELAFLAGDADELASIRAKLSPA